MQTLDEWKIVDGHLRDIASRRAALDAVLDSTSSEPSGRAKFQILVTVCERCKKGHQEGAGVQVAIDAAAVERALCDAQHIGSTYGSGGNRTSRTRPSTKPEPTWDVTSGSKN